ncbi:MAG: lipoate protein ligase C-terminal domain-containing protein, partial [Gemmatimonadaceae bacterium]
TLLLDSNLDDVTAALKPKPGKVESKGVKSIRSRVANISEFLREPITVIELRDRILERIFGSRDRSRIAVVPLGDEDWSAAQALVDRRSGTWAWNFGENPPSNVQRAQRFPAGEIDVRLNIQKGHIESIRLFGDYMGRSDIGELESRLRGIAYDRDALISVLGGVDVAEYFGDISREDVLTLLAP